MLKFSNNIFEALVSVIQMIWPLERKTGKWRYREVYCLAGVNNPSFTNGDHARCHHMIMYKILTKELSFVTIGANKLYL